jgi:hypothetical protein
MDSNHKTQLLSLEHLLRLPNGTLAGPDRLDLAGNGVTL